MNMNVDVNKLMSQYTRYLEALGRSEKTIPWYLFILERFFQFLESIQGVVDIARVGRKELTSYILHLRGSDRWPGRTYMKGDHGKLSPYSIRGYVAAIKAFWNWLLYERYIDNNPLVGYPLPEVPENIIDVMEPKYFEEFLRLIDRSDPVGDRYYCIFLLLFDTGARISEVVGIELDDFFEMKEFVTVLGKRKIERRVPILPETRRQINRYISRSRLLLTHTNSIYLFPRADGNHVTVNSVQQYLRRLIERSGLNGTRIYCHLFRHSFATHTINNGANIVHVKEIMGHKSIATTLKYTHLKPADLQKEHARYSPVRDLDLTQRNMRRRGEKNLE